MLSTKQLNLLDFWRQQIYPSLPILWNRFCDSWAKNKWCLKVAVGGEFVCKCIFWIIIIYFFLQYFELLISFMTRNLYCSSNSIYTWLSPNLSQFCYQEKNDIITKNVIIKKLCFPRSLSSFVRYLLAQRLPAKSLPDRPARQQVNCLNFWTQRKGVFFCHFEE